MLVFDARRDRFCPYCFDCQASCSSRVLPLSHGAYKVMDLVMDRAHEEVLPIPACLPGLLPVE